MEVDGSDDFCDLNNYLRLLVHFQGYGTHPQPTHKKI